MAKKIEVGKDYGPATMPSQLKVIQSHLDDAKAMGAKFLVGGADSVKGAFVEPVIMVDVPESSTAMTQETFGPTLAINKVVNTDEAIRLSNASSYGLAAAVFSKRNGERIASSDRRHHIKCYCNNEVLTQRERPLHRHRTSCFWEQ
jgi:acyl-CoA reductase-like NAD-dependent aldehyde dehydrogenase